MSVEANEPAPWNLTGNGYVLLYRFSDAFSSAHSEYGMVAGGFGIVMLIDYHTTNVGPYREVLFIPGRVVFPAKTGYSVSKIYVSTMESVINGQVNWGLPKQLAQFDWETSSDKSDHVRVCHNDESFVDITLKPFGWRFPLTSAIVPPLVQHRDGKTFVTRLKSNAQGQLAHIQHAEINGKHFPPFNRVRPLIAVKVIGFKMVFPVAEVISDSRTPR